MNRLLVLTVFIFLPVLANATSIFDQLKRTDPHVAATATLTLPLDSLTARSVQSEEAEFTFVDNNGRLQHWSLKVTPRGKFRRLRCAMPPLKLDFKKKELEAAGLARHDKYKLVLPCFEGDEAEALILKEYLAYQAYELITPLSFRTQLLKLTLRDVNGGKDQVVTAFLIEDTDEMAERNHATEVDTLVGQSPERYNQDAEATHALFQYLIGNGDWSMLLQRNVKVVRIGEELFPVGYDFDFTGWVGSPYAVPNSNIGQTSIYERVYLGYAQPDAVIQRVLPKFKEQRRALLKLVRGAALDEGTTLAVHRFVSRFFSRINGLEATEKLTLYDLLRGDVAEFIPLGEAASSFHSTGR